MTQVGVFILGKKHQIRRTCLLGALTVLTGFVLACGTGYSVRPALQELPGRPKRIAIRHFENDSQYDRVAIILSDAIRRVLALRANVEIVDESENPDSVFSGRIVSFKVDPTSVNASPSPTGKGLPGNRVLVSEYTLRVKLTMTLYNTRKRQASWVRTNESAQAFTASAIQLENEGAVMNSLINESRNLITLRNISNRIAEGIYNELVSSF